MVEGGGGGGRGIERIHDLTLEIGGWREERGRIKIQSYEIKCGLNIALLFFLFSKKYLRFQDREQLPEGKGEGGRGSRGEKEWRRKRKEWLTSTRINPALGLVAMHELRGPSDLPRLAVGGGGGWEGGRAAEGGDERVYPVARSLDSIYVVAEPAFCEGLA